MLSLSFIKEIEKIIGRENYFLDNTDDSTRGEILASFIKQFYLNSQFIPPIISVETELEA